MTRQIIINSHNIDKYIKGLTGKKYMQTKDYKSNSQIQHTINEPKIKKCWGNLIKKNFTEVKRKVQLRIEKSKLKTGNFGSA